jgi:hypothetical protein
MASPDSQQLSNYEEFSRRALPQIFRAAPEKAINEKTQPIEEKLKSQLVGMIRDCQDSVFSTYRSRFPSNTAATPSTSLLSNPRLGPPPPDPNSEGPQFRILRCGFAAGPALLRCFGNILP